ncbi:P-type Ca(2+) transporter [Trifolium repens]|nr:P-type Ca(2+) transporter [Trifolium repens]
MNVDKFTAGKTKVGDAVDRTIKIITVAVIIVVVAVPEGLPLAVTLTRTHFLISKISNKERHKKKSYKSISTGSKDVVWKADPIVEEKDHVIDPDNLSYGKSLLRMVVPFGLAQVCASPDLKQLQLVSACLQAAFDPRVAAHRTIVVARAPSVLLD